MILNVLNFFLIVCCFFTRKFLQKSQLAIPDDLRKDVNRRVKDGKEPVHPGIFDAVQAAVEQLISQTTYPNFLKSDLYLQHVQSMQVHVFHKSNLFT